MDPWAPLSSQARRPVRARACEPPRGLVRSLPDCAAHRPHSVRCRGEGDDGRRHLPPGDPFPSQARLRRRPRHERGGQNDRNSQNERDERNGLGRAKARLLAALPSRATSSQCAGASIIGGVLLYLLAFLARRAHVAEAQAFCATVHSTGVEMDMSLRVSLLVKMGAADQSTLRVRCTGTR